MSIVPQVIKIKWGNITSLNVPHLVQWSSLFSNIIPNTIFKREVKHFVAVEIRLFHSQLFTNSNFHFRTTVKCAKIGQTPQYSRELCWKIIIYFHGATAPSGPGPPHYRGFMITLRHTTLGRTPLDEWSTRRRDLYLTIHNTHKRQTSMPPAGFEPVIPASERQQNHALHRAATVIGEKQWYLNGMNRLHLRLEWLSFHFYDRRTLFIQRIS
jgi:hypothetical protein